MVISCFPIRLITHQVKCTSKKLIIHQETTYHINEIVIKGHLLSGSTTYVIVKVTVWNILTLNLTLLQCFRLYCNQIQPVEANGNFLYNFTQLYIYSIYTLFSHSPTLNCSHSDYYQTYFFLCMLMEVYVCITSTLLNKPKCTISLTPSTIKTWHAALKTLLNHNFFNTFSFWTRRSKAPSSRTLQMTKGYITSLQGAHGTNTPGLAA